MYQYKEISNRSTFYELSVRRVAKELTDSFSNSLEAFIHSFHDEIKNIERRSAGYAHNYYKAVLSDKNDCAEIWHLDSEGEKKRLVAKIYPIL